MDDPHQHFNNTSLSFITEGSQVEVTSDHDGFTSAWYVATVIHPPPVTSSPNNHTRNNLVYIEYRDLLSEDGSSCRLREYANVSHLRPSPVPDTNSPNFQLNDLVDAFYRDRWSTGVITSVVDTDKFVVSFRNPNEEIQFRSSDLRIHKEWVGGRWVQPQKQEITGWMFTIGKKVEVSFDATRDVWFPATVLKNSGNSSFLVEYQQPGICDGVILYKVTVDYHHIRPSPPHLRDNNFVLLEKVDAYYDFGWWSGVITKELADNRYNVFFKHTKREKEFIYSRVRPHLEWKGGKWFNTSQGDTVVGTAHSLIDNQIEQEPPIIGKQSPAATSIMKSRRKNLDSNTKSSPKVEMINDDSSKNNKPPSVGQPEGFDSEVSEITEQNFSKTESLSHGKKVHSKREKNIEVKTPTDSSQKRGRLSNELKSLQALEMGSVFDPIKTRSQEIAEKIDASEDFLFVVLGLQCNRIELLQGENVQKLPNEKTQNINKNDDEQKHVPQAPSTVLNQKETERDVVSIAPKRKRGRPPKLKALSPKTPVTAKNNIDSVAPSALSVVESGQRKEVGLATSSLTKSLEENQGLKDALPNEQTGQHLQVQSGRGTKKYSARKGKRGKRRMISINTESPAQDSQEPSEQNANGSLEKDSTRKNSEASDEGTEKQSSKEGEKSLQIAPCDMDSGNVPFVKTTSLWKTIESMEAFQMLPQNPHFRPLSGVRIGAREGLAIGTMVTFSTMVDKTCGLRFDDPRSTIEDCLETVAELENNGFDVEVIRERLSGLLLLKDKQEVLECRSKAVVKKINQHNIQEKKSDEEVEAIDRQIRGLEERKKLVLLKKEKRISEIGEMEAVNGEIEQEIREISAEFNGLAVAPFVDNTI